MCVCKFSCNSQLSTQRYDEITNGTVIFLKHRVDCRSDFQLLSACSFQITGDLVWANDKVAVIQQNCLDDILNMDHSDLNDTEAVVNETSRIIEQELLPFVCQPFDCNGNGRCVNGTCVCYSSQYDC